MRRLLVGTLAGALATVPMTAVMLGLHRRLPAEERYPLPPREITQVMALKAGLHREVAPQLTRLSLIAHFGYGAATGALYAQFLHRSKSPLVAGSAYGIVIWAVSYLGWLPAAGILQPANRHPNRRNAMMIAAHLVWGASLAVLERHLAAGPPAPAAPNVFTARASVLAARATPS